MSQQVHWNSKDVQALIDHVRETHARGRKVVWRILPRMFPNRTPKACRAVWDKHKNNPQYIQREEK